jgi:hypothetical protein
MWIIGLYEKFANTTALVAKETFFVEVPELSRVMMWSHLEVERGH